MVDYALQTDPWRDEALDISPGTDLTTAVALLLARHVSRATRTGLHKGYHWLEESAPTIRGRWQIATQLKRRPGVPVPIEIGYDDFTPDIPANRILKSALVRLINAPEIRRRVRTELQALSTRFTGVQAIPPGSALPTIRFDRTNQHYRSADALARLVLSNRGVDLVDPLFEGDGLLVNMANVFERFVTRGMTRAAHTVGAELYPHHRAALDRDQLLEIQPDLVLFRADRLIAVADAKYKLESPAGYPNADIYQALTYAVRHSLQNVHLIYAKGERDALPYVIEQAGVTIHCHALDLNLPGPVVLARLADLTHLIIASSASQVSSPMPRAPHLASDRSSSRAE